MAGTRSRAAPGARTTTRTGARPEEKNALKRNHITHEQYKNLALRAFSQERLNTDHLPGHASPPV
jgi:hypothetical protein